MIATGLSQVPYKGEKYYYRLKNHSDFLKLLKIDFVKVNKRMTRDFEVTFHSNTLRDDAIKVLKSIKINNIIVFQDIEIRDKSLFVTLSYSKKIFKSDYFEVNNNKVFIINHIVSVAFKNGEHCQAGYAFLSKGIDNDFIENDINVWEINDIILKYFSRPC